MKILGIMSGSSLDGLDLALFDIQSDQPDTYSINLIHATTEPLNYVKHRLARVNESSSAKELLQIEGEYSIWIAEKVKTFLEQIHQTADYISLHGHTVMHIPELDISHQLGDGGIVAALTGIPTVSDFRKGDMAIGGQGTPLTPILDHYAYNQYDAVVNLGGICNISYALNDKQFGYDLYPCNQVLNHYAAKHGKEYDKDGEMAQSGRLDPDLYTALITNTFVTQKSPKSLDNNWIRQKFISSIDWYLISDVDKMHTFCLALTHVLVEHLANLKFKTVFVSGGGINNRYLRHMLSKACEAKGMQLIVPEAEEINFKECKLMALLAYLRVHKQTNILSSVTGASRDSIGGAIYL